MSCLFYITAIVLKIVQKVNSLSASLKGESNFPHFTEECLVTMLETLLSELSTLSVME